MEDHGPCGTHHASWNQDPTRFVRRRDGAQPRQGLRSQARVRRLRWRRKLRRSGRIVRRRSGRERTAVGDRRDRLRPLHDLPPRPVDRSQKVPIITWGNGTCAKTEDYGALLRYVASQGFFVVAANSRWVGGGNNAMTRALDFAFAATADARALTTTTSTRLKSARWAIPKVAWRRSLRRATCASTP